MTIKARLMASAAISVGLTVLLIVLLGIVSFQAVHDARINAVASGLAQGVTDLLVLTDDYVAYQYPRSVQQWQATFDSIEELITLEFETEYALLSDLDLLEQQFLQIKLNQEKLVFLETQNAPQEEIDRYLTLKGRLSSHIDLTAQKILSQAFQVANSSQNNVLILQRRSNAIVLCYLTLMLALIVISTSSTIRRINRPLKELIEGALRIEEGDLTHTFDSGHQKTTIEFDNEIGTLALAFNSMTQKLVSSLEKMQAEITERKRAEERARRLLEQQIAVNQLALALGETRDIDRIYDTIYQHIEAMVGAWAFVVSFYDDESRLIRARYVMFKGRNLDVASFPPIPLAEPGQGPQSQVIHTGRAVYTPDHRKAMEASRTEYIVEENGTVCEGPPPEDDDEDSAKSALYVPMKIEGKTIGVMQLQSAQLDAYTQEDIDLLAGMANVAAVAVQNARLYDVVQRELAERKQVEVALRESEEKYRLLAETARDYIVVHDLQGRITYVNQAGLAFSGYSEEEILLGPITKFVPPEHLEALSERRDKRVGRDGERYLYESEFVNKAGERVPVEVGSSPIEEDGKITSVLLVARDITERMRAEEELRKHREHLEELVRERTAELRKIVNLMAGREVRMAELKGVIRKLRAELEDAGLTPVADDPLLAGWEE